MPEDHPIVAVATKDLRAKQVFRPPGAPVQDRELRSQYGVA